MGVVARTSETTPFEDSGRATLGSAKSLPASAPAADRPEVAADDCAVGARRVGHQDAVRVRDQTRVVDLAPRLRAADPFRARSTACGPVRRSRRTSVPGFQFPVPSECTYALIRLPCWRRACRAIFAAVRELASRSAKKLFQLFRIGLQFHRIVNPNPKLSPLVVGRSNVFQWACSAVLNLPTSRFAVSSRLSPRNKSASANIVPCGANGPSDVAHALASFSHPLMHLAFVFLPSE